MSKNIVAENKDHLINKILSNPVYSPKSGMVQNLKKALSKLSVSDLSGLAVIIDQKMTGATWRFEDKT